MDIIESRKIHLPKGGTLEVEMSEPFIQAVKKHFNLGEHDKVEDDHVRMFVWGAVKNAVDKAEKEGIDQ